MSKIIGTKAEADIKRLSKENYSYRQIKNKLKEEDLVISVSSICRVLKNIGIKRQALSNGEEKPKVRRPPTKRTPSMVRKVQSFVAKRNPMSYRDIRNKTGLGLATISKVIHHDLDLETKNKTKVHKLSEENKKNRKTNCRKLYEKYLASDRWKYAVTLDEALVYLDDSNRESRICYVNRGETVPESWVFEKDESFKKGFMVVGILTGKGTIPLIRVPSKVKINAQFYVDYVLKPLFTEHLPKLYRNEMDKVFFHHDKASSHTSHLTTRYLEKMKAELGISYIDKEDIPVKTPDASPLDFFGFGYLKQRLGKRRARTLDGIWKISQEEWSKIDVEMIEKTFSSWKRRLRMVVEKDGEHIEQVKSIHKKLIK